MSLSSPPQSLTSFKDKTLLFIAFDIDSNSQVLAWQQRVGTELAQYFAKTIIVAEKVGTHSLPESITVLAMPRVLLAGPLKRLKLRWLMLPWLAYKLRSQRIDVAFYHMCFEWAYRLLPLMRCKQATTAMWYAHGAVSWRLRIAERCVDRVFSSSKEGFRLKSKRLQVIGQAIDLRIFPLRPSHPNNLRIAVVGRISERKGIHICLEALSILRKTHNIPACIEFVGAPVTAADKEYNSLINELVRSLALEDAVIFTPPQTLDNIHQVYWRSALHLNLSSTGSMDKVVLESLACGCPVLTSNDAYRAELKHYPDMVLERTDPPHVAERLRALLSLQRFAEPQTLRALVEGKHDLSQNARQIVSTLSLAWADTKE
ncbi:MAG: glycosyltransferase [Oligoflexia bacterium]|nr:glycosyltransferase [Oligoflexia bacterium]